MITIRKSQDRGHVDHGWLKARHSFSFASYYDPRFMGFRGLRVINEDTVAAGKGFGMHSHDNMEIITYVMSGALRHKDSLGNGADLKPGEVQRMSAGSGIRHSEVNPSGTEPLHLMQIWIEPAKENIQPSYDQREFPFESRRGKLTLVVSPDGAENSMTMNADARLYAGLLDSGQTATLALAKGRHAWVQLARGELEVNGKLLSAGDAAAISDEASVNLRGVKDAEMLVFDLA